MEKFDAEGLKKICVSKDMPFSNFLGAVALEEVVKRISESDFRDYLWLQNSRQLNEEQYKQKIELTLEYDYVVRKADKQRGIFPGEPFSKELAEIFLNQVFARNREKVFDFKWEIQSIRHYAQLGLDAFIDGMQVPITIKIYPLTEERVLPRKEELKLMLGENKKAIFYSFPAESLLAEKFIEIAVKLELIRSLENYYDIYRILNRDSVDGRKVKDHIEELCREFRVPKDGRRLSAILEYRDYTYMKKRWKTYLRSMHTSTPSWEDVMERFGKFYQPIWEAVIADDIFFGDWMPELGRFLG